MDKPRKDLHLSGSSQASTSTTTKTTEGPKRKESSEGTYDMKFDAENKKAAKKDKIESS
jgi:hypothetical protein